MKKQSITLTLAICFANILNAAENQHPSVATRGYQIPAAFSFNDETKTLRITDPFWQQLRLSLKTDKFPFASTSKKTWEDLCKEKNDLYFVALQDRRNSALTFAEDDISLFKTLSEEHNQNLGIVGSYLYQPKEQKILKRVYPPEDAVYRQTLPAPDPRDFHIMNLEHRLQHLERHLSYVYALQQRAYAIPVAYPVMPTPLSPVMPVITPSPELCLSPAHSEVATPAVQSVTPPSSLPEAPQETPNAPVIEQTQTLPTTAVITEKKSTPAALDFPKVVQQPTAPVLPVVREQKSKLAPVTKAQAQKEKQGSEKTTQKSRVQKTPKTERPQQKPTPTPTKLKPVIVPIKTEQLVEKTPLLPMAIEKKELPAATQKAIEKPLEEKVTKTEGPSELTQAILAERAAREEKEAQEEKERKEKEALKEAKKLEKAAAAAAQREATKAAEAIRKQEKRKAQEQTLTDATTLIKEQKYQEAYLKIKEITLDEIKASKDYYNALITINLNQTDILEKSILKQTLSRAQQFITSFEERLAAAATNAEDEEIAKLTYRFLNQYETDALTKAHYANKLKMLYLSPEDRESYREQTRAQIAAKVAEGQKKQFAEVKQKQFFLTNNGTIQWEVIKKLEKEVADLASITDSEQKVEKKSTILLNSLGILYRHGINAAANKKLLTAVRDKVYPILSSVIDETTLFFVVKFMVEQSISLFDYHFIIHQALKKTKNLSPFHRIQYEDRLKILLILQDWFVKGAIQSEQALTHISKEEKEAHEACFARIMTIKEELLKEFPDALTPPEMEEADIFTLFGLIGAMFDGEMYTYYQKAVAQESDNHRLSDHQRSEE